jgi:hypothetical protein
MSDWLDKSLQDLAAEDPPAEALAEVRMRVLQRVQPRRRAWLRWLVPAAAAAAIAVWFVLPAPTVVPPQERPAMAERLPAASTERHVEVAQVAKGKAARTLRPKPGVRPKPVQIAKSFEPRILPTGSPDFVQIESGDPDVVILWSMNSPKITDRTGDQK